jgi:hypothetical protein
MKSVLIVLVAVFAIPLLTLATLYVRGGKVVIVHNDGTASFETSQMIGSDAYMERTPSRVVQPKDYTWIMFYPHLKGPLKLRCVDGGGLSLIQLGPDAPTAMLYADVTLAGCSHLVKRSGFSL